MKPAEPYRLVLVSCANPTQAKLIARTVVEKRLAACVNVLRRSIDSYYRWKGKVEKAREVLLFIKTTEKKLARLPLSPSPLLLRLIRRVEEGIRRGEGKGVKSRCFSS